MTKRIAIIQGHPDPTKRHLLHALADAYAEGATVAGHEARRIEVAKLEFALLRTQEDFETGTIPPALVQAREDMRWAQHWLFLFPLWHGTKEFLPADIPATVKRADKGYPAFLVCWGVSRAIRASCPDHSV